MKAVILFAVAVIVFIGSVIYAFNKGYDEGFIASEKINKLICELYERRIEILKLMLKNERGDK